ncbi:unnamed protein product [Caenorhabditis angaria]|uniref:C2H2-type domain-containing protein n=1 Tax=Caenorhabditis angaria TaxID=860376 RepID=A0A9P1IJR6_9PELO|nr:unnamed protein product [Caenorhabditis angaria]
MSYIQINIYNENLQNLLNRGIDLHEIFKEIGLLDNSIISEIPIVPRRIPEAQRPFKRIAAEIVNVGVGADSGVNDDYPTQESTPSTSEEYSDVLHESTLMMAPSMETSYDNSTFDNIYDALFKNDGQKEEEDMIFDKPVVKKRAFSKEYMEILDQVHQIQCQFEGCNHVYSWKVKYGKLRLVDHALTHISEKRLPCHLCGVLVQNVRQIRNHYNKEHPDTRPIGYGMKDMPIDDNELRMLWRKCYRDKIEIIGEASSVGNEKMRRIAKKRSQKQENPMELIQTILYLCTLFTLATSFLEHGQAEEPFNPSTFVLDLSDIDHANGAEIPRNLTEEDTKIIPTNIDFSALKEAYAKENKAERFLPSRLFFDEKK